jgi:hypothetical protein
MNRILSVLLVLFLISSFCYGQSFYSGRQLRPLLVTGGTGTSTYLGELANPGDYLDAKPNVNVGLQYYLNDFFSVRSELNWFQLQGTDAKADDDGRTVRNLSFKSDNFELSFTGHLSLFPQGQRFYLRPKVNVYGFAGFGFLYFNPKAELNGEKYALQPLKTEQVDYSRIAIVIPYGIGFKYKVNAFFNVGMEIGARKTFTDYLDDVSTVFPNKNAFTDPIASALFDRGPEVGYTKFKEGSQRGDPKHDDGYHLLNIKVEYYLPNDFLFHKSSGIKSMSQRKLYNQKRKSYNKPKRRKN